MVLLRLLGLSREFGAAAAAAMVSAASLSSWPQPWWWMWAMISISLVLFAGIMSGLTLGLMSLGLMDLEVLQQSGTDVEKRQASKIMPVVRKQHQLLVTLLLCNAAAMEALPIFLDDMFNEVVAVILSVTFVLVFGEVIPQAVCSRHGLVIGADMIWLVKILMALCWPISYPVGKILDHLLGHNDSALFRRAQLKALVSFHGREAGKGGDLTHAETTIIQGALDLNEKTALHSMTPIESTFSLDIHSKLDWEAMGKILARGHSRVPVYEGNPGNLIGVLLVKSLLTIRAEAEILVSAVSIRRIPRVPSDMPLYNILNEFQKGGSHMAAVTKAKGKRKSGLGHGRATTTPTNSAHKCKEKRNALHGHEKPASRVEEDLEKGLGEHYFYAAKIYDESTWDDKGKPAKEAKVWDESTWDDKHKCGEESRPDDHYEAHGHGTGDAHGHGTGDGHAHGTGDGTDDGTGDGTGDGNGDGHGDGYGYGHGHGDGYDDHSDCEVIGIITMEDVMEELLQVEIVDETDEYIDVHKKVRVVAAAAHVRAGTMLVRRVGNPQMGLSKQGQGVVNRIRHLEKEAKEEQLATHDVNMEVTLTEPLLSKCELGVKK